MAPVSQGPPARKIWRRDSNRGQPDRRAVFLPRYADGEQGGWKGSTMGGKHTEPVVWPWRYPCSSEGWGEGDGQAGTPGPLRSVWSRLVRTKPGPTRGTIAINRIYFVQLLLTYTQPQGLPKWVLGPEGWPLVWCLKSVDRHTQGCGLTAAGPGCPLRGSWVGGAKARPITLGQLRPLDLECPEHGMAGVKLGAG